MDNVFRFPDPESIRTRQEFGTAVSSLRESAGLTVRELAQSSGVPHGTVGSWSAGHHVPTRANEPVFRQLLAACGLSSAADQELWLRALARVRRTSAYPQGNSPYPGLQSFQESDAQRFFGRSEMIEQVRSRVHAAIGRRGADRIVFVVGASGSGKSSLLRAGLIPALRADGLEIGAMVPGAHPLDALRAMAETATVLVVDQFEETWTQCGDAGERREFLELLTGDAAVARAVVLGLRADFYGSAAAEPELIGALDAHTTVVGPLTKSALRQVMVEPARLAGCRVEPELVHRLLGDLAPTGSRSAHDVGALPLLSHALLETWRRAEGTTLTVAGYEAAGGIAGAVQQRAEAVYHQLTTDQRSVARRVVVRLIDVEGEKPTRRRVHRSELSFDDNDNVDAVIGHFAQNRLVTVEAHTVALAHEALIDAWDRLRDWVAGGRDAMILHRRLTVAAQVWADSNRDPSTLLGPARLPQMREWADGPGRDHDLNVLEREFLATSTAHEQRLSDLDHRRRRRLQQLVAALVVLLVAALVSGVIAIQQRAAAQLARDQAVSRQIAGDAVRLRDSNPALATQLALAGYRVSPTVEARSALLDSSAVPTPVRLTGPPGNTLVTAGTDGDVAVWSADGTTSLLHPGDETPRLAGLPLPTSPPPAALAVSGAGTLLARTANAVLELWDITDRHAPQLRWTTPVDPDTSVTFGGDGRSLVAGAGHSVIRRWTIDDPAHPTELAPLPVAAGHVVVASSAGGALLAAGGKDRSLRVWDTTRADAVPLLDLPADGSADDVQALRFSPDGTTLAVGMRSAQVRRWRFEAGHPGPPVELPPLGGFTSYVDDVAFSPDGSRLAAGSSDNSTRVWRLADDTLELSMPNPAVVGSLCFGDDRSIVTASIDGTVRIWSLPGPIPGGARAKLESTRFDRAETTLLAAPGRGDQRSYLWDLTDPKEPKARPPTEMVGSDQPSGAAAIAPDATVAAIGATSGRVYLFDITGSAAPRPLASIPAVASLVADLSFTADGKTLVVASQDHPVINVWDVGNPVRPQLLSTIDTGPGLPRNLDIGRAGTLLAAATSDNLVRLWDIADARHPRSLAPLTDFDGVVRTVAISPDGRLLAAGGDGPAVRLFEVADPTHPHFVVQLAGPTESAYSLDFDSRSTTLALGGDGGIWLWDLADPRRPRTVADLTAYQGRVNDVRFGRDGTFLAAGGNEKVVRLWATDPDRVADAICRSGSTPLTLAEWKRYTPDYPLVRLCP